MVTRLIWKSYSTDRVIFLRKKIIFKNNYTNLSSNYAGNRSQIIVVKDTLRENKDICIKGKYISYTSLQILIEI